MKNLMKTRKRSSKKELPLNLIRDYKYIFDFDRKQIIAVRDLMKWAEWMHSNERWVAQTFFKQFGNSNLIFVSTVFLGLDHNLSDSSFPVLFETMIFGCETYNDYQDRYIAYTDAVKGHLRCVNDIVNLCDYHCPQAGFKLYSHRIRL